MVSRQAIFWDVDTQTDFMLPQEDFTFPALKS